MSDYTPTLDELRGEFHGLEDEFDRAIDQIQADAKREALEEAAVAAFRDRKIQGLQRVLIGSWLRARQAGLFPDESARKASRPNAEH